TGAFAASAKESAAGISLKVRTPASHAGVRGNHARHYIGTKHSPFSNAPAIATGRISRRLWLGDGAGLRRAVRRRGAPRRQNGYLAPLVGNGERNRHHG